MLCYISKRLGTEGQESRKGTVGRQEYDGVEAVFRESSQKEASATGEASSRKCSSQPAP